MNISDITSGPVASVAELIDLSEKPEVQLEPAPSRDWAFRGQPADYGTPPLSRPTTPLLVVDPCDQ